MTNAGDYQLTVTVDGCSSTSDIFDLIIHQQPIVNIPPVAPILCADGTQSITLNATVIGGLSTYTYSWTGPNGFASFVEEPTLINVTSLNDGVYSLVVTDANGCVADEVSVDVEITDGIVQPVIASTGQTCEDGEVVLSVPVYQGNSVTYLWFYNGNPISNNSNELIISPAQTSDSGNYIVLVTVDGCGNTSEISQLEIYPQTVATINSIAPITCVTGNEDLNLISNVTVGTSPFTYSWTGPNGFTSFDENPTLININTSASGTYSLVVTDANGCQSDAYSIEVDITNAIPEPVIIANAPYCEGESATLVVPAYTGINVNYEWTLNGNVLPFNNNEITINPVSVANAGNYQLTVEAVSYTHLTLPTNREV